ncbi:MAG: nifS, partial [Chlamydiia bacterium]|nr:nifS [Chlamydiia bacterium]
MKTKIYLDNNATTAIAPLVIESVIHAFSTFGNPSSAHSFGQEARALVVKARDSMASFLKVKPHEIIFTSSGTESINMLLRGLFGFYPVGHIITSSVEHAACYNTVQALEAAGCKVSYLMPGLHGAVTVDQVVEALTPQTRLITLMAANNETGVITDLEAIGRIALERGIPFIVDGVALLGKEPITIPEGVSAIAFSGHKIHAPKGVGITVIRKGGREKLAPYLTGGPQELGRRAGTEDVPAIVGLGRAIELLSHDGLHAYDRMRRLRDEFEEELLQLGDVLINGQGPRISNTSNMAFLGVEGELLLMQLDREGVAVSHGSACTTGALEPSRILLNMG